MDTVLALAQLLTEEREQAARKQVQSLRAEAEQESLDVQDRLERTRVALFGRVLYDLHLASWQIQLEDDTLFVLPPDFSQALRRTTEERILAKQLVRRSMVARVQEQLQGASARRLMDDMERPNGIESLLADGHALSERLRLYGSEAIQPYLEPARKSDGDDPATGLSRYSIFRYLRFLWSFPYGDVPGRTLPFLIRDRGLPNAPVCGMLCLASPVLRLSARDHELGLTPAWLEAISAGLDFEPKATTGEVAAAVASGSEAGHSTSTSAELSGRLRKHLEQLCLALRQLPENAGPSVERTLTDIAELLHVPVTHDPARLAMQCAQLGEAELEQRLASARSRLCTALIQEVREAILRYHFDGLDISQAALLAAPESQLEALQRKAVSTTREWKASRAVGEEEDTDHNAPDDVTELSTGSDGDATLVLKKRANQLLALAKAWKELLPLQAALETSPQALQQALREGTRKRSPGGTFERLLLSGGQHVMRGLSEALLQRKVDIAATQIAEVSLCGAIPPYNELLVGKLSALLALSREVADEYHRAYDQRASIIQSQLAGKEYMRSASLLALTTTSFYGVGSAQYNRLSLPCGQKVLRWKEVGQSKGHGTLHFSEETVRLAALLSELTRGQRLITSRFGEGPSERLRKLRDAFSELGFPADELLLHGMARIIYVASLTDATRPGVSDALKDPLHYVNGPTQEAIVAFWRQRWLSGRITPARLQALASFDVKTVLLSGQVLDESPTQLA